MNRYYTLILAERQAAMLEDRNLKWNLVGLPAESGWVKKFRN